MVKKSDITQKQEVQSDTNIIKEKGKPGRKKGSTNKKKDTNKEKFDLDSMLDKMAEIGGEDKLNEVLAAYEQTAKDLEKLGGIEKAKELQSILKKIDEKRSGKKQES